MTNFLFGRVATLVLVNEEGKGIDVSNLRVAFDITKTASGDSNAGKIFVYNMSQTTRVFAEQQNMRIRLNVGYDGFRDEPLFKGLFLADIQRIQTQKQAGDMVTSIEAGESLKVIAGTYINVSFKQGVQIEKLLNVIISKMQLERGTIEGFNNQTFLRGFSFSGRATDALDFLAQKTNTNWSIQGSTLYMVKEESSLPRTVKVFTPQTGLIGSPNKKSEKDSATSVQFKTLMQPDLLPNQVVRIESRFVQGDVKIQKIIHNGDTKSGNWFSDIEATL